MADEQQRTLEEQLRSYGAVLDEAAEAADSGVATPAPTRLAGRSSRRARGPWLLAAAAIVVLAVVAVGVLASEDDPPLDLDVAERPVPATEPTPSTSPSSTTAVAPTTSATPPTTEPAPTTTSSPPPVPTTAPAPLPPQLDLANRTTHVSGTTIAYPRTWHTARLNPRGLLIFSPVPIELPGFPTAGAFGPITLDVIELERPTDEVPGTPPTGTVVLSEAASEVDGRPAIRRETFDEHATGGDLDPSRNTGWWVHLGPGDDGSERWMILGATDHPFRGTSYEEVVAVLDAMVATIELAG